MNVTATARLTAEQCLARLAACPALPRGERLAAYAEGNQGRLFGDRTWHIKLVLGETVAQEVALGIGQRARFGVHPTWFRDWAAPVRRLREERRALRAQLLVSGEYLMTITAEVVSLRAENNALKSALETLLTGPARNLLAPEEDLDRSCDNCGAAPGASCNCHLGRFIP